MRRWLILCLLAACERAGDSQNPLGPNAELATGPTGPRAIIDASIATLPNDAAPMVADAKPVVTDAAVARADARRGDDVRISQADVDRIANALVMVGPDRGGPGDMSRRGGDLARQIDDSKPGNRTVAIGGGTGGARRGNGDVRIGTGTGTGQGPKVDGAGGTSGGKIDSGPTARVSVSSKRGVNDTTLTIDVVVAKMMAAYTAGIKRCYKSYLEKDPSARGRITLTFEVTESGRATNAHATGFATPVDACLTSMMAGWRFPIPKDKDGEATTANFEIALQLVPD
jgi:hypothetical protein